MFQALPREGSFHLSTLMHPIHREQTLLEIRHRLKENKTCRVVSTSLVEAGVDLDFPFVFRELAGLDSIIQAGGRCNREGKRTPASSIVSVFELDAPPPPQIRINIGATREALQNDGAFDEPDRIRAYFHSLRSLSGNNLD